MLEFGSHAQPDIRSVRVHVHVALLLLLNTYFELTSKLFWNKQQTIKDKMKASFRLDYGLTPAPMRSRTFSAPVLYLLL